MDALEVWLYDRRAGRLERSRGELSFTYAREYAADAGPPLSSAMPVREEPYGHTEAESFFANLLPEGKARRAVAKLAHVSDGNDYGLLAALGGDCAGAVSLLPPGTEPSGGGTSGAPGRRGSVDWLDDARLAAAIDDLPRRPLMADPDGDIRISLAGAQDKLVIVVDGDRIGLPVGSTPSTHIVKTPIAGYDDTVANEAFCLRLARELGLGATSASAGSVAGREVLLVERYDRRPLMSRDHAAPRPPGTARIHQEDFCQALGLAPESKYENEGGPGLAACFRLVSDAVAVPAPDTLRLVDAATFNFLIGNHDAHAKNFSLLHAPGGTRLAPFYDLLSTTVYELGDKMAMKLGGEYRAGYVRRRHVERFASDAGLGVAPTLRRVRAFTDRTARAAESLAAKLRANGGHRPVIDRIVATVVARAEQLDSELRTGAR